MPERIETFELTPVGGLDVRQDVKMRDPGSAIVLQNMEPGLRGGYRRINGFSKLDSSTVTGIGRILGVAVFGGGAIACREVLAGTNCDIYKSTGSGWSKINNDTRIKTTTRYRFWKFNWTGTERIIGVDGLNLPFTYDGTTYSLINAAGAPADAKYVTEYRGHIFYSGYSSNRGAILFGVPNAHNDFTSGSGAGEIVVGDEVVGLYGFRDQLIIFCRNSLFRLTGSSKSNFVLVPITKRIGCMAPDSIQEINGDLMFLAPDGIRTVAATERIGDFELGTISSPVQPRITELSALSGTDAICSTVIRNKNQYRLFFPVDSIAEDATQGVLGGFRSYSHETAGHDQTNKVGGEIIEWADVRGIKPSCLDSSNIGSNEYVLHGGYDGFVYRQESGNSFSGVAVHGIYQTPHLDFSDGSFRKIIHRISTYIRREGTTAISMYIIYNHGSTAVPQPAVYTLAASGLVAVYGTAKYDVDIYGIKPDPNQRNLVEGSGFHVSLKFETDDTTAPWAVEGALIEFAKGGRR